MSVWFVAGSFMPDVPLFLLTAWHALSIRWGDDPSARLFGREYDELYFGDPVWIVGHNVMHAPLLIAVGAALGLYLARRDGNKAWLRVFWFCVGCGLHSAFDIATHYDDGPLLLFPFDFQLRFASPISYWDPRHYGRIVMRIEHLIDLAAGMALLWAALRSRRRRLQLQRISGQTD